MCKDRLLILLADTLYMPRLRVNLLLARQICQSSLKGSFNKDYIFFKLYKERVIEATIRNGLYIVIYVVDGYYDKAFVAFLASDEDAKEEVVSMVKY